MCTVPKIGASSHALPHRVLSVTAPLEGHGSRNEKHPLDDGARCKMSGPEENHLDEASPSRIHKMRA